MRSIDGPMARGIVTILLFTINYSRSHQISEDEQSVDLLPNDSAQLIEQNRGGLQPGEERQPQVDVPIELSKLKSAFEWDLVWPTKARTLGSVSAVSFDNDGNVVVFHRGEHVWDTSTFSLANIYMPRNRGPIADKTIVAFNRRTGSVAYEWGDRMFYMPHGLHIDHDNNVWVTDVALHQVMKFGPNNRTKPDLTLGVAFQPGSGQSRFCKPTAVAVLPNGDFFVADGYCNARIIKYSRSGEVILTWGKNSFQGVAFSHAPRNFFAVPHALALANDLGLLCVADRENGRVQCFNTSDGSYHSQYHSGIIGDRLFSVAYAPINGGQLYVVNGPQPTYHKVLGFVIDMQTKTVISKFGPDNQQFDNPHDIIVSPDGSEVYVAQLSPYIAFKFTSKDMLPLNTSSNAAKPSNTTRANEIVAIATQSESLPKPNETPTNHQLIMIIGLFVSFVCITLFALWIVARRRKLDSRNRRHAWDFPAVKSDGFKLGKLLDRDRKRGFEKLNQDGSDEESNSSTNALLSNAQFA